MCKFVDLSGERFGRWTALERAENDGGTRWLCKCNCGTVRIVRGTHLRRGASKSCGCLEHELLLQRNYKHGETHTHIHNLWLDIKKRCYNPRFKQFKDYGGRGISVCEKWKSDYLTFRDWALQNGYKQGLSIDRINNDGDYSPENCRFTTAVIQNNNKRNNRWVSVGGEIKTISQWAHERNIDESVIRNRLALGWSEMDAVLQPIGRPDRDTGNGRFCRNVEVLQ